MSIQYSKTQFKFHRNCNYSITVITLSVKCDYRFFCEHFVNSAGIGGNTRKILAFRRLRLRHPAWAQGRMVDKVRFQVGGHHGVGGPQFGLGGCPAWVGAFCIRSGGSGPPRGLRCALPTSNRRLPCEPLHSRISVRGRGASIVVLFISRVQQHTSAPGCGSRLATGGRGVLL